MLEMKRKSHPKEKDSLPSTHVSSVGDFCAPDYVTPENQIALNGCEMEEDFTPCPKSLDEKLHTTKSKRLKPATTPTPTFEKKRKGHCKKKDSDKRMSPPSISNNEMDSNMHQPPSNAGHDETNAGFSSAVTTEDNSLSRYRTEYDEIEQISKGDFCGVFKVLEKTDGWLYAVKRNIKPFSQEFERLKAMMDVLAFASLGSHENIVHYHCSWFENDQLHVQLELCDLSLSMIKCSASFTTEQAIEALYQVAKALQIIHGKGIVHLGVNPDNIYLQDGVYKLGDFICSTHEESDANYLPQEFLNKNDDHLVKVDIFSLGAVIYELIYGFPLPDSECQSSKPNEGKLPLMEGCSLQLLNLLKVMMDHDPVKRPSASELLKNPIFDGLRNSDRTLRNY